MGGFAPFSLFLLLLFLSPLSIDGPLHYGAIDVERWFLFAGYSRSVISAKRSRRGDVVDLLEASLLVARLTETTICLAMLPIGGSWGTYSASLCSQLVLFVCLFVYICCMRMRSTTTEGGLAEMSSSSSPCPPPCMDG